jgi:hypothetical protein
VLEKRTSGPNGRMEWWGFVRAKARTYQPAPVQKAKGLRRAQPFFTLPQRLLVHTFTGARGFRRRRPHHRVRVRGCDAAGAADRLRHHPALPACEPLQVPHRRYRLHG